MPQREHNLDFGTIGSAPCELALNRLLINLNDPKVTRAVLSRHNRLREELRKLEVLKKSDRGLYLRVARLCFHDYLEQFKPQHGKMPEIVYTHALCCYRAIYRRAIKE